ncbi:MAG: glycosyltransferase [Desulfovibrio sp.]|nr:glycosyltransferase [Desulfovibrio sp.]
MKIAYSGKFLKEGFLKLGHDVIEFDGQDQPGRANDFAAEKAELAIVEFYGGFSRLDLVERVDAPLAAYFIDSPLNEFWIRELAPTIDYVFVDQPQCVKSLAAAGIHAEWLPLPARDEYFQPPREKRHDITFIGTVDARRIKRNNLLKLIGSKREINIQRGLPVRVAQEIFSQSKIILNENLFPGLTMRVGQGLGAGTIGLTEKAPFGDDFGLKDHEDLLYFGSEDILSIIDQVLAHYEDYSQIAEAGRQKCRVLYSSEKVAASILGSINTNRKERAPSPDDFRWAFNNAKHLFALRYGGNLSGIYANYKQFAATEDMRRSSALVGMGDILARAGKIREATARYDEAMNSGSVPEAYLRAASLRVASEEPGEAIKILNLFRANFPEYASPLSPAELADRKDSATRAIMAIAKIYYRMGRRWDMGLQKSFNDSVSGSALETARLSWIRYNNPDAFTANSGLSGAL